MCFYVYIYILKNLNICLENFGKHDHLTLNSLGIQNDFVVVIMLRE